VRLHERGILYAPDFIANGGGALAFGLIHRGVTDEAQIASRLSAIEGVVSRLFEEAAESGESPLTTAERLVRSRLR
jgi:leucine dehydrogenase